MKTPVDKLTEAWDKFVKVYNEESPKIVAKVKEAKPAGIWALRICDSDRTLILQDIHMMPSHGDVSLDEARELFEPEEEELSWKELCELATKTWPKSIPIPKKEAPEFPAEEFVTTQPLRGSLSGYDEEFFSLVDKLVPMPTTQLFILK
jgi:hypothetical protein